MSRVSGWTGGKILIIEDDPGDQEIIRRALHSDGYQADLHIVGDGRAGLEYLRQHGHPTPPGRSSRPDLILLDLNLPGMSGKKVLAEVKGDPDLRCIPIVVVSTSARMQDIRGSYDLGCNSYLVKPLEAHRFIDDLREIYSYWFGVTTLSEP
jgi:CheY-like chemotaxis protein